ncbi:MAG: PspC domain-containing protein [Actinomycetota bacterium]
MNESSAEPPTIPSQALTRPRAGRLLGGVGVGLADYIGVDPMVVRAAFVVLAFLGGIGVFLYLLAWLMIPPAPSGSPGGERLPARLLGRVRGRPAWVGVILLAVGGALVAHQLGVWHPTIFWGVTLVVSGIALFREDRGWSDGSDGVVAVDEPPTNPSTEVVAPPRRMPRPGWTPRWPFGPRGAAPSSPPRVRRERSALGWLALGAVLLALGGAAVLNDVMDIDLSLTQYLALALAVLGAGLLVGAWLGRARWVILPGILLIPLVLATSLIDVPITGGIGDRYVNPQEVGELQRTYELTAGDLVIDLTSMRSGPGEVVIRATVATGRIRVVAPDLVSIDARAHAGAGSISLLGRTDRGIRVDVTRSSPAPGTIGNLILDLRTGIGEILVYRATSEEGG